MRHRRKGRVLGRSPSHQRALLRNLASALMLTEREVEAGEVGAPKVAGRIITTLAKAKEMRPLVERCITIAKRGLACLDQRGSLARPQNGIPQLGSSGGPATSGPSGRGLSRLPWLPAVGRCNCWATSRPPKSSLKRLRAVRGPSRWLHPDSQACNAPAGRCRPPSYDRICRRGGRCRPFPGPQGRGCQACQNLRHAPSRLSRLPNWDRGWPGIG